MKNKLIYLLPLLVLSSCGSKVDTLGSYGLDHSANWNDNYYTYYKNSLKTISVTDTVLDYEANKVFTSYEDEHFKAIEPRTSGTNALSYYADFDKNVGYGPNMKLSNLNNYVREGVTSKLFDGQMFCHGYYEAARVQIKESGISLSLGSKLASSDYLYLNFKSALNFKQADVEPHLDDITVHITFYNESKGLSYSYSLKEVPTNAGESYIFYGFSLEGLDLNNATDIAISYTLDKETYNEIKGTDTAHALLLYEFGFKNPTFQ